MSRFHQTNERLRFRRENRGFHVERLEARIMLHADVVISEVVASNLNQHFDFFDSDPDWFEVHNRGTAAVDLKGWYVTDDLANLTKWRVPSSTFVQPDERLVIYASGRDTVATNGEFHTNFSLNEAGEGLALVEPGGAVVDSFQPTLPPLATNVSYGVEDQVVVTSLVEPGAAAAALVPVDDTLGQTWTGGNEPFAETGWLGGTTGVGYDTSGPATNLPPPVAYWPFDELSVSSTVARDARGRYDSTVVGATLTTGSMGRFGEALSFDGVDDYVIAGVIEELRTPDAFTVSVWFFREVDHAGPENATRHNVNNVLIAQASDTANDNLEIGTEGSSIDLYVDTDASGGAAKEITQAATVANNGWQHLVVTYDSTLADELKIYLDGALVGERSEPGGLLFDNVTSPFSIGLSRPEGSAAGAFEGLIDDVAVWDTAIDASHVSDLFAGISPIGLSGYAPQIALDLQAEMFNQNSSAFVRIPFTVAEPDDVDMLRLRMQHNGAFVAYVNGQEIARSNFTGTPAWNSVADMDRPDEAAFNFESFVIPTGHDLLQPGENILAVQLVNHSAAATRSVVLPELESVQVIHRDVPLIGHDTPRVALVPDDNSLGTNWTGGDEPFDASGWIPGSDGIGYQTSQAGVAIAGPIAYWTFDELKNNSSVLPDQYGRYDGTVVGATLTQGGLGRFGEALIFDGDDDYVTMGVIEELRTPDAFSVSVWFYQEADHNSPVESTIHNVNNVLISQASDGGVNDNLELGTEVTSIEVYIDTEATGGPASEFTLPATVMEDQWHHLVMTYDSSSADELKLYLDGSLVGQRSEPGGLLADNVTSPFTIGLSRPGGSSYGDFEGLIDDVAIWEDALDAQHVAAIFNGTAPPLAAGPGYAAELGIDLQAVLQNQQTSAYLRVPFTVDDLDSILSLELNLQYDDAHVTYINGVEVARSNISGTPVFDSVADANRPDVRGLFAERTVLSNLTDFLHTGENILAIQGINASAGEDRFIIRPELSANVFPGTLLSFMDTPTPGMANVSGFEGLAAPPVFSIPGGTFTDTIQLELTAASPTSQIRYTTDGSLPVAGSLLYTAPIVISTTSQVRAKVFQPGFVPSDIESESYTRLGADLLNYQGSGNPFASDVPFVIFDAYGQGINGSDFSNIGFSLFEPTTGQASVTDAATVDSRAGLRVRGSSSAGFAKKPYALELRRDDSDEDLSLSLLGMPAEADWVLQGPFTFDRSLNRNRMIYDLSNQAGRQASRTQYIEVFLNTSGDLTFSDYVGVYVLIEKIERDPGRVNIDKLSTQMTTEPDITGGYILKIDRLDPGDSGFSAGGSQWAYVEPKEENIEQISEQRNYIRDHINDFVSALNRSDYSHPTTGQHYTELVDLSSIVDHHLLNELAFNVDAFVLSAYWTKERGGLLEAGPLWDFDRSMESNDGRDDNPTTWYQGGGPFWKRFFTDLEFRQAYIDRWAELRQDELSDANIEATIDRLSAELGSNNPSSGEPDAVTRNFNRWGQAPPRFSGGFASGELDGTWQGEIAHQKAWLWARTAWLDSRFVAAPEIDPIGGAVTLPQTVTITGPAGETIYYTIDGTDPRLPGGAISPAAMEYMGPIDLTGSTTVKARSFQAGYNVPISSFNVSASNPEEWSGLASTTFQIGTLNFSELNYHPQEPTAAELLIDPIWTDNDFEFAEVVFNGPSTYDLSGITIADGIQFDFTGSQVTILNPGDRVLVVRNQAAFEARYGTGQSSLIAGQYSGRLANGGELLTLVNSFDQVLQQVDYNDNDPWPRLPDGFGATLEIIDPLAEADDPFNWRFSSEFGGTPGTDGLASSDSIVVNEILTQPVGLGVDIIELHNPAGGTADIGGWWISDRLDELDRYVFPANTQIAGGSYLLLDSNIVGFGFSGDQAEDVVLVDPTVGNTPRFVDHASFGPVAAGVTQGRWPDPTGQLFPMTVATLGEANSGPRFGPLVLSEVMYNPPDPGDGSDPQLLEFVEIFNPTFRSVALDNWSVDLLGYTFPAGASIGPGQYVVLVPFDPIADTDQVDAFNLAYRVNIQAQEADYLGPYPGRILDSGDRLTLQRADVPPGGDPGLAPLVIEDQITFDDTGPWPVSADGNGQSLQRVRIDDWGNDAVSWLDANPSPGRFGPTVSIESLAAANFIGEVGTLTTVTDQTEPVMLSRSYANPVVFALPSSFIGTDPVVVRVSNVQADQFDMFLAEPSNLNGIHGVGETVSYVVLEAGRHVLEDGTPLEVGVVSTSATVGVTAPTWEPVGFSANFSTSPVVFSQPQTVKDQAFLSTRQDLITATGFELALEPEQLATEQNGKMESVGYLAIEPSSGIWNGMAYEVQTTGTIVSGDFGTVSFATPFLVTPSLIASLASYAGVDNSHLRYQNLGPQGVELKVEEDTTFDTEMRHTDESVAYLALGGQGQLTALTLFPETQVQSHSLVVTDAGRLNSVQVTLDVVHTRLDDLDVFLEAPDGTTVELFTDIGGDGDHLFATTLDDRGIQPIAAGQAPLSGLFQPEGSLAVLRGKPVAGTWTLHITDDTVNMDVGALLSWSLEFDLATEPEGNLNHDNELDADDIDLLFANVGAADPEYDVDHDGDSDLADVDHLVLNIMGKRFGDVDLDDDVDITDFNRIVTNFDPLAGSGEHGWSAGNLNGDAFVDISDFNVLAQNFAPLGYLQASTEIAVADQADAAGSHAVAAEDLDRTSRSTETNTTTANDVSYVDVPLELPEGRGNGASSLLVEEASGHYVRPNRGRRGNENERPVR